jgi:hypothetical protein
MPFSPRRQGKKRVTDPRGGSPPTHLILHLGLDDEKSLRLREGQRSQPGSLSPTIKLEVTILGDHRWRGAAGLHDENP